MISKDKLKVAITRTRSTDSAVFKMAEALSEEYEVHLLVWDRRNNVKQDTDQKFNLHTFNVNAPYDTYQALLYLPLWWIYEFIFLLRGNFNIIHSCDLDTLWPAILTKYIKNYTLFYIIYDFYANNFPSGNYESLRNILRNFIAKIEKRGINYTKMLFLVDESRLEEVKGAKINNLVYLYNSPPDTIGSIKLKKGSDDKYKIMIFYGGVIGWERGLEFMIEAVKEFSDVKLVYAGIGKDEQKIKSIMEKYENMEYLGWIPSYEGIIKKTLEADIIFRFNDPIIPKTKYESPNKLFEAMMCSKPIIVSDKSSMANIVRKEKCGMVVPYNDIEKLKQVIQLLRDHPEMREKLGKNGRKAYDDKYGWKIMEERLLRAYSGEYYV